MLAWVISVGAVFSMTFLWLLHGPEAAALHEPVSANVTGNCSLPVSLRGTSMEGRRVFDRGCTRETTCDELQGSKEWQEEERMGQADIAGLQRGSWYGRGNH